MSLRLLQVNLHHSKAASAALLLRLADGGADLVLIKEPWVVGGKVAGLGTKDFKLLLDPKEGKIRTCILAKRQQATTGVSLFLTSSLTQIYFYATGVIPPPLSQKKTKQSLTLPWCQVICQN